MPLGPMELAIILVILVVIFGAGRLADVGGALGKSIREFKSAAQADPDPVAPAAGRCAACGTTNPGTQGFCGQCGTRLVHAA